MKISKQKPEEKAEGKVKAEAPLNKEVYEMLVKWEQNGHEVRGL